MGKYSAIKKELKMLSSAAWMDLEIIILHEVCQTEREKYYDITYMWTLKYDRNKLIYKTNRLTDTESNIYVYI